MIMRRLLALPVLAITAGLCWLPIKTPLNIYDEGLALVGGWRLLQGEVPFRDYWALYPPGQSYLLALIFNQFGPTIMAERLYDVAVRAIATALIYLVATALLPSTLLAVIATIAISLILASATFFGYIMFPALLLAFAALWSYGGYQHKSTGWRLFGTGLLIGCTALFRIDVGGYLAIAIVVSLLLQAWRGTTSTATLAPPALWRQLLLIGGGALVVAAPVYGYLALVSNPSELFTNLLLFPTTTFRAVRRLPLPELLPDWSRWGERGDWQWQVDWIIGEWARFYLPLLIYALTTLTLLFKGLRTRLTGEDTLAGALLLFGLGLFLQAMSRYDAIHALPTSLPAVLLLAWLWQTLLRQRWWYLPLPLLLTVLPLFVYLWLPYAKLDMYWTNFPPTGCYATLPRASCVPISQDQAAIVTKLEQLDPTGNEAVFVAAQRHDQLFINDVSLYFLAGRPIPTRYHELHPGIATTAPVQQTIIEELTSRAVPWIFIVQYPDSQEPNDSAKSSGVKLLDDYIRANYQPVHQAGIYQLWQRRKQ